MTRSQVCKWLDDFNGRDLPKPQLRQRVLGWSLLIGCLLFDKPTPGVAKAEFITMLVIALLMSAASIVISELLRPKPEFEDAKPAGNGDFKFPTASEGRPVPLIWGRNKLEGPNVVWWGDMKQIPIKEEIKTGMWSKEKIIKGYRYYVGIQMALCHGVNGTNGNVLKRVWVGEKEVFNGTLGHEGAEAISKPELFGGDKFGTGGLIGTMRFHDGRWVQDTNAYLVAQQDGADTPGYGGTCYVAWEAGYIGNSTSIDKWAFEVERYPDNLGLTGSNHIIGFDCNPAEVIYESYIDTDWGNGRNTSVLDLASFQAVGEVLFTEGNGFGMVLDRSIKAAELRRLVLEQIDAVVYEDRSTGLITLKLIRDDYTPAAQQRLTNDNMSEVKEFSRQTWDNTTNQVRIGFTDRSRDYFDTFAVSNDPSNQNMQDNEIVSATIKYPGVKDKTLATTLAARELRFLSYPLAKATVTVNREFWDTNVGDVKLFNDTDLGLTDLAMRVVRVDYGNFTSGKITLTLVQDIFSLETGFFGEPEDPSWSQPVQGVAQIPLDDQLVLEAPKAVIDRDPNFPLRQHRLWCGAIAQDGENSLVIRQRHAAGTPAGTFEDDGIVSGMVIVGELNIAINSGDAQPTTSIELNANESAIPVLDFAFSGETFSPATIGQDLAGMLYIDNEFLGAATVISSTASTITIGPVYRGLMDSTPADHAVGAKVWICFSYMGLSNEDLPNTDNVDIKLITFSRDDELAEGTALTNAITMARRYDKPYPPSSIDLNTVRMDQTLVALDGAITNASGDDQGIDYDLYRRDFELLDEVAALDVDDTSVSSHTQEQQVEVYGIDSNGVVSSAPIFTNLWAAGNTAICDRASVLAYHNGVDTNPSIRTVVRTRHTNTGVLESLNQLILDSTIDSAVIGGLFSLGRIPANSPQGPYIIADGAQDLNATISSAIGQNVEYRINAGAWTNLITAAATTGLIANALLTTADEIYIRHADNAGSPDYTFLLLEEGTTDVAYGIIDTTAAFDSLVGWYSLNEASAGTSAVPRSARFGSLAPDWDDTNGNCPSVAGQTNYGNAVRCYDNAATQEWLEITDANMEELQFVAGEDWTVMLWVKVIAFDAHGTTAADFQHIIGKVDYDSLTANSSWYLTADAFGSNRFLAHAVDTGATTDSVVKTALTDDTWYHCALVYTRSGNFELFVDGSSAGTDAIAADLQTSTEPLSIGGAYKTGAVGVGNSLDDGHIQDVRVYRRAVGSSEISAIAALGQPL